MVVTSNNLFGFLLLLLNGNDEIVDWKLTKSAGYSEVKDLPQNVKDRKGVNVMSDHVDNCCKFWVRYQ